MIHVKIIDPIEHHSEWAVFEVIESKYNHFLYRNSDSYKNETEWYYRLVSHADGNAMPSVNFALDKSLWVAENEICDFDMAHNICTKEIF